MLVLTSKSCDAYPWGVVQMSGRLFRTAVAALRVSFLGGCGALSLMALSAGTATADDGAVQGLLGSLTPVVESAAAPVEPLVQGVTAPLRTVTQDVAAPLVPVRTVVQDVAAPLVPVSGVSGLISGVPDLVGSLDVSGAVAPITGVVDSTLAQVPIVNQVVPSGTTTAVSQPLLESVDATVAPVLRPVEQILAPVVGVVDPVLGVVDPVVPVTGPVDPVAPVAGVVDPVVGIDPVVPVAGVVRPVIPGVPGNSESLPEGAAGPVGAGVVGEGTGDSGEVAGSARFADAAGQVEPVSVAGELSFPGVGSLRFVSPGVDDLDGFAAYQGARHVLPVVPQLVVPVPEPKAHPVALPSAASGASGASAGSQAPGGAGAADTPSVFILDLFSAVTPLFGGSADLPQGPAFDPGSTPD